MALVNLNSEDFCKLAYRNYYIGGNTMGLTRANIEEIENKWGSKVNSWINHESTDEISYDFDDTGYNSGVKNGKNAAEELTGYDGKYGNEVAGAVNRDIISAGGATAQTALHFGEGATIETAKEAGKEIGKKVGKTTNGGSNG
jgi:hypothetical protein